MLGSSSGVLQWMTILFGAEQWTTHQTHLDWGEFVVRMSFQQFNVLIFTVGCCPNNVQGHTDLAIFWSKPKQTKQYSHAGETWVPWICTTVQKECWHPPADGNREWKHWSLKMKWNSYHYRYWGTRGTLCTETRSRWEIEGKRPPQHIFYTINGWLEVVWAEAGQWYQSCELQQGKQIWWTGDNLLHHSQITRRWTLTDVSTHLSGVLTLMAPLRWRKFYIFHHSTFRSGASDWLPTPIGFQRWQKLLITLNNKVFCGIISWVNLTEQQKRIGFLAESPVIHTFIPASISGWHLTLPPFFLFSPLGVASSLQLRAPGYLCVLGVRCCWRLLPLACYLHLLQSAADGHLSVSCFYLSVPATSLFLYGWWRQCATTADGRGWWGEEGDPL